MERSSSTKNSKKTVLGVARGGRNAAQRHDGTRAMHCARPASVSHSSPPDKGGGVGGVAVLELLKGADLDGVPQVCRWAGWRLEGGAARERWPGLAGAKWPLIHSHPPHLACMPATPPSITMKESHDRPNRLYANTDATCTGRQAAAGEGRAAAGRQGGGRLAARIGRRSGGAGEGRGGPDLAHCGSAGGWRAFDGCRWAPLLKTEARSSLKGAGKR